MIRATLVLLATFTLLCGVAYPGLVTGIAQVVFPSRANGSPVTVGGRVVGSALVGQAWDDPKYLWGRPSALTIPYDGRSSTGSNLGPTNPALADAVKARVAALRAADPGNAAPVPVDLVTASGSGLDPHVSPAAALYQVPRIAHARGMPEDAVRAIVNRHVEPATLGLLGAPRVNVLAVNVALDGLGR
jgi:potassium-transporting ATPase KdpC subunit